MSWSSRTDGELVGVVEEISALRSALAAVEAAAVAEVDARGVAKDVLHYASTGDWLTHLCGLRRSEGGAIVAHAHASTTFMGATRDAPVEAAVSPEQATVIVAAVDALPSGAAIRARGESVMVENAAVLDATDLARTGRHLAQVIDPEATDRRLEAKLDRDERAAHASRFLMICYDGGIWLKGRGSAEDVAVLKAALVPLTCPVSSVNDDGIETTDPHDGGARMWDALVLTARHVLDVGRTHRLVTPAIWQALMVRDGHSTFPTCTRPPVMCHAHHLTHWVDGKRTELDTVRCCADTTIGSSTTRPGK